MARPSAVAPTQLPMLHGRETEREVLGECLAETANGRGGVLLVTGPPGIGKSRIVEEAGRVARRLGVRALSGRAHEGRQTVPFAPLLDALISDDEVVPPASVPVSGAPDQAFWFTNDLQDTLERATVGGPIAVLLDDLQWADPPTLRAVRAVSRELAGSPVAWVLATRSDEAGPALSATVAGLERDGARRLDVGPLAPEAIEAAVRDVLGAEPDEALLALASRSEGNPFVLVELLLGLRDEDRLRVRDGRATAIGDQVPGRLTQSMHERLARLAPDARQVLRSAAALGQECTPDQLATMLGLRPFQLAEALDATLRADLLVHSDERLTFRHDLLREAVLDTLPKTMRRALQREAATVLLDGGASPIAVAQQLVACAEHGDRAASATLRAAARALLHTDTVTTAQLLESALALLPADDGEWGAVAAETVLALHRALRNEEAHRLAKQALDGRLAAQEEAEMRLSLARLMGLPNDERARESEIALALPGVSAAVRARHQAWLPYNRAVAGHLESARATLPVADATDDAEARVVRGLAIAALDTMTGACADALRGLDAVAVLIRESAPGPSHMPAVVMPYRMGLLGQIGRLDEAQAVMLEGLATARRLRDARMVWLWTQAEGMLHAASGRLGEARAVYEEPGDPTLELAPATYVGAARMLGLAQVGLHTGDSGLMTIAVGAAQQLADDGNPTQRSIARWTLALNAAWRGDLRAAAGLLVDDPLFFALPAMPHTAATQPKLVLMALAAGDRALAERSAAAAETYAGKNPGTPLLAGVAAHARGLLDGDPGRVMEAARVLATQQRPLLHAAAVDDAGMLLARAGHTEDAVTWLDQAFAAYHRLGATTDVRRVGHRLRDLGARRQVPARRTAGAGWEALSDAELSVVRLIAAGATNREAAEQLYLSPHTVSSHVRSAFRKLDIHSRVELAAIVARRG